MKTRGSRNIGGGRWLSCGNNGGTDHGLPTYRSLPRALVGRGNPPSGASQQSRQRDFSPIRNLRKVRPSGAKVAMFAVAIAVVMGALFYGLNNTSVNQAGTEPGARTAQTQPANPAAPPGMRDVTPKANSEPGTTTGAAPARPAAPSLRRRRPTIRAPTVSGTCKCRRVRRVARVTAPRAQRPRRFLFT